MAAEPSWFPSTTVVDNPSTVEWGPVEWADEGAFADADYPEPDEEQHRFYTIGIRRGQLLGTNRASVAVLGVTRDLEIGYESRFPADVDGEEWTLLDHDEVPAAVCKRPPAESAIPEGRRAWYRDVLERAHTVDDDGGATPDEAFTRASEVVTDGGQEIEPLATEYVDIDLGEFVEIADQKASGEDIPGFDPDDEDLDLVRLSATFLDSDGLSREYSICADGFDPDAYRDRSRDDEIRTDGGQEIDADDDQDIDESRRFFDLPTPDRFFLGIDPVEIDMQPLDHDDVRFRAQNVPGGKFGFEISAGYEYAGYDCSQHFTLDLEGAVALRDALNEALATRGIEPGDDLDDRLMTDGGQARTGNLEEVFYRATIVEAPDGIAIGAAAVPARRGPEPDDVVDEEGGEDR